VVESYITSYNETTRYKLPILSLNKGIFLYHKIIEGIIYLFVIKKEEYEIFA